MYKYQYELPYYFTHDQDSIIPTDYTIELSIRNSTYKMQTPKKILQGYTYNDLKYITS